VNLRAGPGTNYPIVGTIMKGERCDVQGRTGDDAWWEVACTGEQPSWVAASVVSTAGDMAPVPVDKNIPTPLPTPAPAPTAAATITPTAGAASATATVTSTTQDCIAFHNFLGAPVLGTFTRKGDNKKATLKMEANTDQTLCLDTGYWTYTLSAPGWQDLNDGLQATAGRRTSIHSAASATCQLPCSLPVRGWRELAR
jgi:hypothetical protein